jgi:hypothetical protein
VKTRTVVWLFALAILLTEVDAVAATSDPCAGLVPPALEEALKQKFPDFRLPRESDYDQNNFFDIEMGGTDCLGIATGSYFGDGVQSYAIILTSTAQIHSIFVVGRLMSSKWSAQVLRDWGETPPGRAYVGTLNPGGLQPTDTPDGHRREPGEVARFLTNHHSVWTATLESCGVAFFYNYNGDKWVHVRFVDPAACPP